MCDVDGWLLPLDENNILNSRDAVQNKDGTYTVSASTVERMQ